MIKSRPVKSEKLPLLYYLIFGLTSIIFCFFASGADEKIGYFDEATHLDHAYSWSKLDPVYQREFLSPYILNEWSCRGFYNGDFPLPMCEAQIKNPGSYPAGGFNYNAKHPPVYHLVNGAVARALDIGIPGENFTRLARFANALWLAGTGLLISLSVRRLFRIFRHDAAESSKLLVSVFLFSILLTHPVTTNSFMYVSNDVPQIFGGAVAFWFSLRVIESRENFRTLVLLPFLLALLKAFTLTSVLFYSTVLLITEYGYLRSSENQWRLDAVLRTVIRSAIGPVTVLATTQLWVSVISRLSPYEGDTPPLTPGRVKVVGIPFAKILDNALEVVFQLKISQTPSFWSGLVSSSVILIWTGATVAILFGLFVAVDEPFHIRPRNLGKLIAGSWVTASVLFYVFISLYLSGFGITPGFVPFIVSRYMSGLLVPLVCAAGIFICRRKFSSRANFAMRSSIVFMIFFPIYEFVTFK